MRFSRSTLALFLCNVLLNGCAPRHQAEVVERTVLTQRQQDERIGGQFIRIVQPGDTLYSIAFVAGLDVNKVAAWNSISDTSRLQAGKRIRLTEPIGFTYPIVKRVKVNSAKSADGNAVKAGVDIRPNTKPEKPKVLVRKSAPKLQNKGGASNPRVSTKTNAVTQKNNTKRPRPFIASDPGAWSWPLRGTLVDRFNPSQGQQGIDIQGQRGQVVKAAAGGEVVYAGNSLKGYGNLVIIKHSSTYLSAYANNQSISVKEGDVIQQAQPIARLGQNSTGSAVAQFQIRKNGNPVDPMSFLR